MALRQLAPLALQQLPKALAAQTSVASRSLRTSAAPRYHYDYEHGPKMFDFPNWPGRQWKVATWIIGMIGTGIGIPAFAVWYQQSKMKAG